MLELRGAPSSGTPRPPRLTATRKHANAPPPARGLTMADAPSLGSLPTLPTLPSTPKAAAKPAALPTLDAVGSARAGTLGAVGAPEVETYRAGPQSDPPPPRGTKPADPPFVVIAGEADSGKTVDEGYSFPCDPVVAAPGALEPYRSTVGFDPVKAGLHLTCKYIHEATKLIKLVVEQGYAGIVFDDFAAIMQDTMIAYDNSPAAIASSGKKNGFFAPMATRNDLREFLHVARHCGIRVVLSTWLRLPKNTEDGFVKGGPEVPSKGMIPMIPPRCDLLLRCAKNPARKPWPGVYICDQTDEAFYIKNRFERIPIESPMNLREILTWAGYDLPRHPGLPWQEEVVTVAATELWHAGAAEDARIFNAWWKTLIDGKPVAGVGPSTPVKPKHVAWTMRDALDRVALWRMAPTSDTLRAGFGL